MTVSVSNVGGTLTGGETVNLAYSGNPGAGHTQFLWPESARLSPRIVDFYTTAPKTSQTDAGVARGGLKVAFSDRQVSEGCCAVQAGSVIFDANVRWHLNQPETLVADVREAVTALIASDLFWDTLTVGAVPTP